MDAFISGVMVGIIMFVFGAWIDSSIMERAAVAHQCAHYSTTTAKFEWNMPAIAEEGGENGRK